MYTAIVLNEGSRNLLLSEFPVPNGWDVIAHHVTLCMGSLPEQYREFIGSQQQITVTSYAEGPMVTAVGVQLPAGIPCKNTQPHITIGVNRAAGGKPVMSNKLTSWEPVSYMVLQGTVQECK